MARRTCPWTAGLVLLSLSGCAMPFQQRDADMNPSSKQALRLLQDRVDALETRLRRAEEGSPPDSRTPSGPLRSVTLRMGTADDRLRMYWADGQTSDLPCTQEGNGTWACG